MYLKKQLNIKITGACNANCSFCGYNRDQLKTLSKQGIKPFKPGLKKIIERLPLLKAKGFGVLHLTGGEPLMEHDIFELIWQARKEGFQVRTGTNGSLLNEAVIKELAQAGLDYMWFSLDTYDLSAHCRHRGLEAYQSKMEKSIEYLHKYKINFFGQTVLSRILPLEPGTSFLPYISEHLKFYREHYGIHRFVFSYPMHRTIENTTTNHWATAGSETVTYTKAELIELFRHLMKAKQKERKSLIINPYLSLWQQIQELETGKSPAGCFAGHSLFFLGDDHQTLRPCYYHASDILDTLDNKPLQTSNQYRNCTDCRDQCFRDPSLAYAAQENPLQFLRNTGLGFPQMLHLLSDAGALILHKGYKHV